ncbi:ROK family protein [Tichowtungia aerotolerans]|uniref:ROK family protein n=1 Tax=Tichowtungia aerotolerans TaxID=2697043 RepID=A0A6P1M400_9BACT|nr:ROK family protein [Tichowtungia aerotolerans]QHI69330.1 ROK family protein [Tichowtungia aerotolerans]
MSLLEVTPNVPMPLDKGFCPSILGNRNYRDAVGRSDSTSAMIIALERTDGCVSRLDLTVFMPGSGHDADTLRYVERQIKALLWARGGSVLHLSGPAVLCEQLSAIYSPGGARAYDANRMKVVYDRDFEIRIVPADEVPVAKSRSIPIGGHLDGCRIGFDLGASDYKLSAVVDGEAVFTTEIPWNPSVQTDPQYHIERIAEGLKLAAEKLPRVDAIGGSAAGAYVDNMAKYASLFRSVPADAFHEHIRPIFLNLAREWNVPFEVLNDGEVTALAGAMSLKEHSLLGIAMGSSEATGFVNEESLFTGNYNELAYVPVDFNPDAAIDPIADDIGCGAQYFSQQAVAKLAPEAGFDFPEEMLFPERLKAVQEKANEGDPAALDIFTTIGIYLGYTLPHYKELYDFKNVLILGRVTSGRGGEVIIEKTQEVLNKEFPELAGEIALHVPDEKSRRVGQAVAAASLPNI